MSSVQTLIFGVYVAMVVWFVGVRRYDLAAGTALWTLALLAIWVTS